MSKLFLGTGAAGFIGLHLVEELVKQGQRVRGIDNLAYQAVQEPAFAAL